MTEIDESELKILNFALQDKKKSDESCSDKEIWDAVLRTSGWNKRIMDFLRVSARESYVLLFFFFLDQPTSFTVLCLNHKNNEVHIFIQLIHAYRIKAQYAYANM